MSKDFIGKYPNFSKDLTKHKKYSMSAGIYILIEKHLIEKKVVGEAIIKRKKTAEFFMGVEKKMKKPNKTKLIEFEAEIIICELILHELFGD